MLKEDGSDHVAVHWLELAGVLAFTYKVGQGSAKHYSMPFDSMLDILAIALLVNEIFGDGTEQAEV